MALGQLNSGPLWKQKTSIIGSLYIEEEDHFKVLNIFYFYLPFIIYFDIFFEYNTNQVTSSPLAQLN